MVVRSQQIEALEKSAGEQFAVQIARELRQQFQARLSKTKDHELETLAQVAIQKAKSYGVVERPDVKRYAEYMVEYEPAFDTRPWAQPVLSGTKSGTEKMDDLDAYTTFELRG